MGFVSFCLRFLQFLPRIKMAFRHEFHQFAFNVVDLDMLNMLHWMHFNLAWSIFTANVAIFNENGRTLVTLYAIFFVFSESLLCYVSHTMWTELISWQLLNIILKGNFLIFSASLGSFVILLAHWNIRRRERRIQKIKGTDVQNSKFRKGNSIFESFVPQGFTNNRKVS